MCKMQMSSNIKIRSKGESSKDHSLDCIELTSLFPYLKIFMVLE